MNAYLGIDLGTGSVKAVLLGANGRILGMGSSLLSLYTPLPGYAQQCPGEWWEAVILSVKQAAAACGRKIQIRGIGLSGQMLGSVLMDRNGEADVSCMIWMDQRASRELDNIGRILGTERILDLTANDPLVSLWVPKLLWLRKNEPKRYARIHKVLFPKDYIKFRLTGEYDIDVTDAAGTMLFNTAKRSWEDSLFNTFEIPRSFVPDRLSESVEVIGQVNRQAAKALEIPEGIPVVAGGGDQMCGAVALGVVKKGVVSSTIGTSGCIFAYSEKCIRDAQKRALLSYCHSVPKAWSVYGCTLAAGGSYQWLRDTLFRNRKISPSAGAGGGYKRMNDLASAAAAGSEGLLFLPYLSGERTPHPDPCARGVFFGLSNRHGAGELCRAVMEGVTYSLRDTVELLREYGIPASQVRAAGGGAASPLWLQMQADVFGTETLVTNVKEAAATGAAMLAAVGTGGYADVEEAAGHVVKFVKTCEPVVQNSRIYDDYYQTYRDLYPALKKLYAAQAGRVERWQK